MSRIHLFPRDLWERCSPRASKTVLGLRLLRSLQSSDSFGGPWTASFPGSLGKRWNLGPLHYLSQFLRNVERPALWPLLPLLVVEESVVVDEEDLQQLRHLDGHVERERDDDLESVQQSHFRS